MGRLIDVDTILIDLDEFEREYNTNTLMRGITVKDVLAIFRNTLLKAKTAYDVDTVVEELDKEIMVVDQWHKAYISKKNTIDIVRKGGVE